MNIYKISIPPPLHIYETVKERSDQGYYNNYNLSACVCVAMSLFWLLLLF